MGANKYSQMINFDFIFSYPEIVEFITERCGRAPESVSGRRWVATGNNFSIWVTRAGDKRCICEGYSEVDNPNWEEHIAALLHSEYLAQLVIRKS